jgi:outer membrane porin, OprD family
METNRSSGRRLGLGGVLIVTLALLGGTATGWAADPQQEPRARLPSTLFAELTSSPELESRIEAFDTALLAAPASQPGAGAPEPDLPWLRAWFPELRQRVDTLPPFLRDSKFNVHLRTYYFNRENPNESKNEAWSIGFWPIFESGWAFDTFQVGATLFDSIKLYGPDDRDGTLLLRPGQESFSVLGIVYGALRYREYVKLTGGRIYVDTAYIDRHDNRAVPNTYEGFTFTGKVGWAEYTLGYLTTFKERNNDRFVSFTEALGASGAHEGAVVAELKLAPLPGLNVRLNDFWVKNSLNSAYVQVDYLQKLPADLAAVLSVQYTDQRAVGDDLYAISKFKEWKTYVWGPQLALLYKGFRLRAAGSFTGKDANITDTFTSYPGWLSQIQQNFDTAGENAFLVGLSYDWGALGLVPGLRTYFEYIRGTDRIDAKTRARLPNETEYDFGVDWFGQKGLWKPFRFKTRAALLDQDGPTLGWQIRFIVDYEFPLF